MSDTFVSRVAESEPGTQREGFAIAIGIVKNNLDLLGEGRVQVMIPSLPAYEPWARLSAVGGGSSRGFVWVPELEDEVLVAFNQNDERDAYVLGGVWSTLNRPPLTLPPDFLIKRVIKTGKAGGVGHEVEFDDALQSITITTSTKQKITVDPLTIELKNTAGTLSIKMDNATQTISIESALKLELKATQLSIEGTAQVDIKGGIVNLQATGPCNIQGALVKIN